MSLDKSKLQNILNAINENIFYKDTEGHYVIATHVCNMLNCTGNADFTIYGKTDLEVQPDKELGRKFYEEDMHIVATKANVKYVQCMKFGEDEYYYEINKSPVLDEYGNVLGIVGIIKDMTELIKLQKKLEGYSITDMMTQTFNRAFYESGQYKKNLRYPVCVIMADINNLKYYNDNYGHKEGDVLIRTIVNNVRNHLRITDIIIRLGGDEFMILLQECNKNHGEETINRIKKAESAIRLQNIAIGTSYGTYMADDENELERAIEEADKEMYANKRQRI